MTSLIMHRIKTDPDALNLGMNMGDKNVFTVCDAPPPPPPSPCPALPTMTNK